MVKLKKYLLTYFLFLSLLTPLILADSEQYLMPGITRDNTYAQDGTGMWTGRTPVEYTRTYNDIISRYPIVGDVDGDENEEIIILADDKLNILNYTYGVGLLTEQTITHGSTNVSTTEFHVTPALIDIDNDGTYEIISSNITHMLTYSYNGSQIVLDQSAPTRMNVTSTVNPAFQNPVIKCAPATLWSTKKTTCAMPITNRSGATAILTFIFYNVDDNTLAITTYAGGSNPDTTMKNTHLADGDGDGYLEAYFAREDKSNGDLYVYETKPTPTSTLLFSHLQNPNTPHTDIIVNDLEGDGGTLDITFGYSSDNTNYDGATYDASTGTVKTSSYCTVISCPEGAQLSANMVESTDTTYCDFSGDVYYYIRNPTTNQDSILCFTKYAGTNYEKTSINNEVNFTSRPVIHQASLHGTTGVLTSKFTTQDNSKQSLPVLDGERVVIPVDAASTGSLDLIGLSSTTLKYYDDAYTNSQYEITSVEWDTNNPVCVNELPTFTISVSDDEGDGGSCYVEEVHSNGTVLSVSPNQTITESMFSGGEASVSFNYFADVIGTYVLRFKCSDQYHTSFTTRAYTVMVSNSSSCFYKGEGGSSTGYESTEEQTEEENFNNNVDKALEDVGIKSSSAKTMIWLILMMSLAFLIFSTYSGEGVVYIIALLEVVMLVLGWVLGMVGAVVLVIVGLITALLLTMLWVKGPVQGG